jgi:hypothetical protein
VRVGVPRLDTVVRDRRDSGAGAELLRSRTADEATVASHIYCRRRVLGPGVHTAVMLDTLGYDVEARTRNSIK